MRYIDYDQAVLEGLRLSKPQLYAKISEDRDLLVKFYRRARHLDFDGPIEDFRRELDIWATLTHRPSEAKKVNLNPVDVSLLRRDLEDQSNTHLANLGWAGLAMGVALESFVAWVQEQRGSPAYHDLFGFGLVREGAPDGPEAIFISPELTIHYMGDQEWRLTWRDWTIEWYKHTRRCRLVSRVLSMNECRQFLSEALEYTKDWLTANYPKPQARPVFDPYSAIAQRQREKLARNGMSGAISPVGPYLGYLIILGENGRPVNESKKIQNASLSGMRLPKGSINKLFGKMGGGAFLPPFELKPDPTFQNPAPQINLVFVQDEKALVHWADKLNLGRKFLPMVPELFKVWPTEDERLSAVPLALTCVNAITERSHALDLMYQLVTEDTTYFHVLPKELWNGFLQYGAKGKVGLDRFGFGITFYHYVERELHLPSKTLFMMQHIAFLGDGHLEVLRDMDGAWTPHQTK